MLSSGETSCQPLSCRIYPLTEINPKVTHHGEVVLPRQDEASE